MPYMHAFQFFGDELVSGSVQSLSLIVRRRLLPVVFELHAFCDCRE